MLSAGAREETRSCRSRDRLQFLNRINWCVGATLGMVLSILVATWVIFIRIRRCWILSAALDPRGGGQPEVAYIDRRGTTGCLKWCASDVNKAASLA